MESRYTILQHETRTFYLVDCPILLLSHAITKDNQNNTIFVQCKFENTLSKEQKACHSYPHILSRSKEQKVGKEKTAIPLKIQLQISFSGIPLKTLTGQRKQQHPDF